MQKKHRKKGLVMESMVATGQMDKLLLSKNIILYLTNYIWWMCADLKKKKRQKKKMQALKRGIIGGFFIGYCRRAC